VGQVEEAGFFEMAAPSRLGLGSTVAGGLVEGLLFRVHGGDAACELVAMAGTGLLLQMTVVNPPSRVGLVPERLGDQPYPVRCHNHPLVDSCSTLRWRTGQKKSPASSLRTETGPSLGPRGRRERRDI